MTDVMILKTEIRKPDAGTDNWIFGVVLSDQQNSLCEKRFASVDGFELASLFKSAVGRYPEHENGVNLEMKDLLENWEKMEPGLLQLLLRRIGN